MTLDEKLDYINEYCKANNVWSVGDGLWIGDGSALPVFLIKNSFIKESDFQVLEKLRQSHNVWYYKNQGKPLNKEGILYINLLYNILQKNNL